MREGTQVEFQTTGGVLTIRPHRRRKQTLAELLAKAKGRCPHREFSRSEPQGRELI
jgi:antitoxin component of MazEF toxin-antitoxin module